MAGKATQKHDEERLTFGGMARWDGLDLFGPSYMSIAYRKDGKIRVKVEPSSVQEISNPTLERISHWPVIRSFFFWGRLVVQLLGSIWTLLFFVATIAVLWLFVRLLEFGSSEGGLGGVMGFFAEFPILPLLFVFFAAMKFTSIGRYHGAEHKVVAAYEKYGEVTVEGAKKSKRVHPRCGTNILIYIIAAALLDPLIGWGGYAVLQFILISEAWYVFGKTRPSVAIGNFLQKYFTTTEPRRPELEVAVESLNQLLQAEEKQVQAEGVPSTVRP
ncbi:MAG: DUF1385 domain-containing protein [Rubrobacteraceae bacterium]